jgi:AcrR family transcriptional regulator
LNQVGDSPDKVFSLPDRKRLGAGQAKRCFVQCRTKHPEGKRFMQIRTKQARRGGRPREFDEAKALRNMQRQLWTTGLSGASLDGIARSAGLNRPSLAAAFGDKNAIYAQAAAQFAAVMEARLSEAIEIADLGTALKAAFDAAIDIYTTEGPSGCFVLCTAPAEAMTNPVCRTILGQALEAIDAFFLKRLKLEQGRMKAGPADLAVRAALLGATLHSLALRARAGWSPERLRRLAAGTIRLVIGKDIASAARRR